jgi:hypothetical protein
LQAAQEQLQLEEKHPKEVVISATFTLSSSQVEVKAAHLQALCSMAQ